jgi:hypothetical protein
MPKPCPNHGKHGEKQKRIAMQKLADALYLLWDGDVKPSRGVKQELQYADIWPGVEGLDMDVVLISFRPESRLVKHKIAFTTDWMLKEATNDIARAIDEQIGEKLAGV